MAHALQQDRRPSFSWSNTLSAWKGRAAVAVLGAAALSLGWFASELDTTTTVALATLLLGLLVVLARAGWIHPVGPLLAYDLARIIRRSNIVVWRMVYTSSLFALLLCLYALMFYDSRDGARGLWTGVSVRRPDLIWFTSLFAYGFMIIQLATIFALVPAYLAGAIAEEKERGTLEGMLITDLGNREIVFGLLLSRLGSLLLILLGGLPVVVSLQFLGGIDPNIILAAFASTGLSMLGLAGVSILFSAYARRARTAILQTYLAVIAYLIVSGASELLLLPGLGLASFPSTGTWKSPITLKDVVNSFTAGNIVTAALHFVSDLAAGGKVEVLLANALRKYAWFHTLLAVGCLCWATLVLRRLVVRDRTASGRGAVARWLRGAPGPALGARPMLWKTLVVEARHRRGPLGLLLGGLLVAGLFWPGIQVLYYFGKLSPSKPDEPLANLLNIWIRGTSVMLGSFLLLGVAVRASGGIGGERERQTLDGLLATTLSNRQILFSKWLASLVNDRWPWFWLMVVFAIGVLTKFLHPLAIPYFLLAWLVYASALAGVGLWFSVASRNTRRALMGTLVTCCVGLLFFVLGAFDLAGDWLSPADAYSLLPPQTLGYLAFSPADYQDWVAHKLPIRVWIYPLALAVCACAAVTFWFLIEIRFRHVTGRELHRDEAAPLTDPQPEPRRWNPLARLVAVSSLLHWRSLPQTCVRFCLMSLPFAVLVGAYFYRHVQRDASLQQALAEAEQFDASWRHEDARADTIQGKTLLHMLDSNYGGPYVESAEWVEWLQRLKGHCLYGPASVPIDYKAIETVRSLLAPFREALLEARGLADLPNAKIPVPSGTTYQSQLENAAGLSFRADNIESVLLLDAVIRAHSGHIDEALASCRARVNLERALDDYGFGGLRAPQQSLGETVSLIEFTLGQGEAMAPALAALQKVLTEEADQPLLLAQLRSERLVSDLVVQGGVPYLGSQGGLAFGAVPPPEWHRQSGRPIFIPSWRTLKLLVEEGSVVENRTRSLRVYAELIDAAKQTPALQRAARFQQLAAGPPSALQNQATARRWQLTLQEEWEGKMCSAFAALAVERFRLAHDRWPLTLDELVPAYLPAVPSDPIDGLPLRYRPINGGVVIYSIGSDGVDNQGAVQRLNWSTLVPKGGVPLFSRASDVGVVLYGPSLRRRQ
jgi:ABC-type transport system involved in multi-copper enzyme maturation permease subunit